jgi:hypothetical protein
MAMRRQKRAPAAPPDYIAQTLADPATSPWLKTALRRALAQEPIAAADDAARLATLLRDRVDKTLSQCLAALLQERVAERFRQSIRASRGG